MSVKVASNSRLAAAISARIARSPRFTAWAIWLIEKAKNLLLNPNLRVSEIAFEVGFQSLTHFNRVFKKLLGQSPTEYRAQLLAR